VTELSAHTQFNKYFLRVPYWFHGCFDDYRKKCNINTCFNFVSHLGKISTLCRKRKVLAVRMGTMGAVLRLCSDFILFTFLHSSFPLLVATVSSFYLGQRRKERILTACSIKLPLSISIFTWIFFFHEK
jgi:hypothetical protein